MPEGRSRKGWIRLQSELSIAIDYVQPFVGNVGKVATGKQRRSFTEVFLSTTKQVEESFGSFVEPIVRVPKWLAGGNVGISKPSGSTSFSDGQAKEDKLVHKAKETVPAMGPVNRPAVSCGVSHGILQNKSSSSEEKASETADFGATCHSCVCAVGQEKLKRSLLKIQEEIRSVLEGFESVRSAHCSCGNGSLGPKNTSLLECSLGAHLSKTQPIGQPKIQFKQKEGLKQILRPKGTVGWGEGAKGGKVCSAGRAFQVCDREFWWIGLFKGGIVVV